MIKSRNGRFLSLTFAQPHFRTPFYTKSKYSWSVDYQTFGTGFHYFCYVMTKGHPDHLQDQVRISSAADISRLTLNANENYSSSDDGEDFLSEMFRYKINRGWINLGAIAPPLESKEQFGIYMLNNPGLAAFDSLNNCLPSS